MKFLKINYIILFLILLNLFCVKHNKTKDIDDFRFFKEGITYEKIKEKVGEPDKLSSDGLTIYYNLDDGTDLFIRLKTKKVLYFSGIEKNGKLIKYVYSLDEPQIHSKKYKLHILKKIKYNMSFINIVMKIGMPHEYTKGWNPKLLYFLNDGRILSLHYYNGLKDAILLNSDRKQIGIIKLR